MWYFSPVHVDPAYVPWTFTLCVARKKFGQQTMKSKYAQEHRSIGSIPDGGANFVDWTLRVIVMQAEGTLMAHRAIAPHGTTLTYSAVNYSIATAFTPSGKLHILMVGLTDFGLEVTALLTLALGGPP